MKRKFLNIYKKNISFLICVALIFLFFFYYLNNLNYGLPYFYNADEIAHLKSVLYFYGFFTQANQNIVEPIYSPLINFILSGTIIFFYNLIFLNQSFSNLEGFFFLNPDKLIYFLRLSSLIISCLSLFIVYLISKKLKLSSLSFSFILISIFFSPFILDTSLAAGKNSILTFMFIAQFYFFIKYILKIENFNLNAYFVFSFLSCIAWGVNYWCATPSLYAMLILHLYKYKWKKLNYFFLFLFLFIAFGIVPNAILTLDNPLNHLFADTIINSKSYYDNPGRLHVFYHDIKSTFNIFITYEKFLLLSLFITLLFLKNLKGVYKTIYLSAFFLSVEPALLFAFADYSYPQLRYFGPSIIFMHICIFYLVDVFIKKYKKINYNTVLILPFTIFILIIFTIFDKIKINKNYLNLINKKYNQYKAFEDLRSRTLIITPAIYRENIENLDLYKSLLNLKITSLNPGADNKNSLKQIEYKKNRILNLKKFNLVPNANQYIFFGGEFLINDNHKFVEFISKDYDFILIHEGYNEINNLLSENHILIKKYESDNIELPRAYLKNIKNYDFNEIGGLGYSHSLYKLK